MKNNKLLFLMLGTFVILLFIVIFPDTTAIKNLFNKSKVTSTSVKPFIEGITLNNVESFSIKIPGSDTFSVVKSGNDWMSSDKKVDTTRVETFINALSSISVVELVSKSDKNYENFGISDIQGILVSVKYSGTEIKFFVGNSDPFSGNFYLRGVNSTNVYTIRGNLKDIIDAQPLSEWLTKTTD